MRNKYSVLIGLGIVGLVITSSSALYYRQQAARYQQEWSAAVERLDKMAVSATPAPAPAVPKTRSRIRTPAPAEPAAMAPRSPEPQAVARDQPASTPAMAGPQGAPDAERSRRRSPDWMENLRTTDPKRYDEMQQRRREMQQYAQNVYAQTTNYFMSRDTSRMSDSDRQEYTTMMTLLGDTWTLSQQLQSGVPPEVRQEVMANVRSNVTALVPLLNSERDREYYQMALAMGQSEDDAAALVNYVNQITSNTSLRTLLPGVRFGGGGPGGGPGGRFFGANPPPASPPAQNR